jgi:protoheme IX farnesyltransferase
MSTSTTIAVPTTRVAWASRLADYVELTKPRIAALELVSVTAAAMVAGLDPTGGGMLAATLVGTALMAASASALTQWLERRSDALMERTASRPLPQCRLGGREVLAFAATTAVVGVLLLALAVNAATAAVALGTWTLYAWVYTPLKRLTTANTAIGAVAGALPVLMGWTLTGRPLGLDTATLFLIVFLWQFPHFMAIAQLYRNDYAVAGMKMLTVVDPTGRRAGAQAVLAALALLPVSLLPALWLLEPVYFLAALVLGLGQLGFAAAFLAARDERSARRLLRASLVYLPALLVLLMMVPLI